MIAMLTLHSYAHESETNRFYQQEEVQELRRLKLPKVTKVSLLQSYCISTITFIVKYIQLKQFYEDNHNNQP